MQNRDDVVVKLMQNIGGETICPRCGEVGKVAIDKFKSRGHVYNYLVVRHRVNGRVRRCIISRVDAKHVQNKGQGAKQVLQVDAKLAKALKAYYIAKKGYTREEKEAARNFIKQLVKSAEEKRVEVCIYT